MIDCPALHHLSEHYPARFRGRVPKRIQMAMTVRPDCPGCKPGTVAHCDAEEVFAKCDEGHQADADGLSEMASLALQYGCPASVVAKHLRHRRYPPHGNPGQPCSISDAIGIAIEGSSQHGQ